MLIVDNGGETLKAGWATSTKPKIIPNYAVKPKREKKLYVADQLESVNDYSGLFYRRPMDKGVILNWELEGAIWNRMLGKQVMDVDVSTTALCLLDCPLSVHPLETQEFVLETMGFAALHRSMSPGHAHRVFAKPASEMLSSTAPKSPASASASGSTMQDKETSSSSSSSSSSSTGSSNSEAKQSSRLDYPCAVVIDSGFSHTTIVPIIHDRPVKEAIQRINVGGKLLTNYLKELVSYRQYNVLDETMLLNHAKEQACYVSTDFNRDLAITKSKKKGVNTIKVEYVLPDGSGSQLFGKLRIPSASSSASSNRGDEQVLPLSNERFSVPELLFKPSDVGLNQMGMAEAVAAAISKCPLRVQGPMWASIVCVGGNFNLPGITTRLQNELRALAPEDLAVKVFASSTPTTDIWTGASLFAREYGCDENGSTQFIQHVCVTKQEWAEMGESVWERKFLV